jgi:Region found in RelA / SpoT proteins
MKEVRRAGEALADNILWNEDAKPEILQTFSAINSFRDSHLFPMRSVRMSVIQRMRHKDIGGFTAARSKRLASIRKKLTRHPGKLDQIQDLAGCRAILDNISGVHALVDDCRSGMPHKLVREYDYLQTPKDDGYRSHHMVFRYFGVGDREAFDGRRVELQIRTRLQHSWATAVEAVGLFRNEDLKAGEGDEGWLRLFKLMSTEFALAEGFVLPGSAMTSGARQSEIKALNSTLQATEILEKTRQAFRYVNRFAQPEELPKYYLIRFDREAETVTVEPFFKGDLGSNSLHEAERMIDIDDGDQKVALVEVDKIDRLAEAYPNYFGDVQLFMNNLKRLCRGDSAIEYSMDRQQVVKPEPRGVPDLAWFHQKHRLWQEPPKGRSKTGPKQR